MRHIGINLFVIGVQSCGIALSLVGHRKREMKSKELPVTVVFGILLFIWALLATLFATGMSEELLEWSLLPGVRALTIWDHMQSATWMLKGSLWTISGLLSIITTWKISREH